MKNDLLGKWGKSDKNKVRFWFPGWSFKLGWRWFLLSAYSHFGHTCRNKNICWENSESSVCMYRPVVLGWTEGIKKGNLCRNVVLVPYRGRIFKHIKSHTFWVTKKIFWIFFFVSPLSPSQCPNSGQCLRAAWPRPFPKTTVVYLQYWLL